MHLNGGDRDCSGEMQSSERCRLVKDMRLYILYIDDTIVTHTSSIVFH